MLSVATASVKVLLYAGVMLLAGGAATLLLVAPELTAAPRRAPGTGLQRGAATVGSRLIRSGAVLGALLLIGAAWLEVIVTLHEAVGRADLATVERYLELTRHGQLARLRTLLAPGAAGLVLLLTLPAFRGGRAQRPQAAATESTSTVLAFPGIRVPKWVVWVARALLGLALFELLLTFSLLAHAAAMGGAAPLAADFLHLVAAAVWAGPLVYLAAFGALSGARPEWGAALSRLSLYGLTAVLVLAISGSFTALTHASDPPAFAASAYGWTLWLKIALFVAVVVVAARNRFRLMPYYLRGGSGEPLQRSLVTEALLVVAVIVATGVLTTTEPPHMAMDMVGEMETTSALENLQRVWEWLFGSYSGHGGGMTH